MPNRSLARGAVLSGIALLFAFGALRLPVGTLSHSGAGLFPLIVSGFLLILALIMVAKSFFTESPPLEANFKSIAIIMASLVGFVLMARYVSMIVAIVWLVFVAAFAGTTYSWLRNAKVALGLLVVAYCFQRFLGLNLRLV